MTTGIFADRSDFLSHLHALPMSQSRADKLFARFEAYGTVSAQENTGLSVSSDPKGGSIAGELSVAAAAGSRRMQVVMIRSYATTEEVFESWVGVVRQWSTEITDAARGAWAREIKNMKKVNDGIPLSVLHRGLPSNLYFTYRRPSEYVVLIDPPSRGLREIFATKDIG